MRMRCAACLLLVLVAVVDAAAVDAPTEAEWAPIQARIDQGDLSVRGPLESLMANRDWPDGWVKLADLDCAAGDYAAAFTHARQAVKVLGAGPAQTQRQREVAANAHWLAIHAANQLGKPEIGLKVFEAFGDRADPRGEVHFRAAESALLQSDPVRADKLLTEAKRLASASGGSVPLGYRFLEARIYEAQAQAAGAGSEASIGALEAAAATYRRALGGEPLPNAWFNLARMQRKLAGQVPGKRDDYLNQAGDSLRKVLEIDPDDADARFELGLVRLEQGDAVSAYNAFNQALKLYLADQGMSGSWMVATAYRGRGTALLQLAEVDSENWSHDEALADLERARQLGESSPDLYNNLLVAYLAMQRRAGGADQGLAAKIAAILGDHGEEIEPSNLALSFFHQANAAVASEDRERMANGYVAAGSAADLFRTALGAGEDPSAWSDEDPARAPLWRFLGHAYRAQAQLATALGSEAGRENDASERFRLAYAAWRVAGAHGDAAAQRHYLAYAARDDATTAYGAAWDVLGWQGLLSLDGWKVALAAYGPSHRWRSPLHLAIWGLVLLALLALALKGFIGRKPEILPAGSRERQAASPGPKPSPQAEGRSADETFLPDTMVRPRKRDQALTTDDDGRSRPGQIPDDAAADESYLPTALPPGKNRAAVTDVANRLAREQEQDKGKRPPRRRR